MNKDRKTMWTNPKLEAFLNTKKALKTEARREIRRLEKEGKILNEAEKLNFISRFVFEGMTAKAKNA